MLRNDALEGHARVFELASCGRDILWRVGDCHIKLDGRMHGRFEAINERHIHKHLKSTLMRWLRGFIHSLTNGWPVARCRRPAASCNPRCGLRLRPRR